jgi:hypothetical protein
MAVLGRGKRMEEDLKELNLVAYMTFRKTSVTFLIITLCVSCAYAKKNQPKYS